jgi:hypothetical protein
VKKSLPALRGRAVPLDAGRTIVPVYEVTVECNVGKRNWWVNVELKPVHILLRTDNESSDGEYREERISVV